MAWDNCKACGALRKVDIIVASDGWHQPACSSCGDPAYLEPHENGEPKTLGQLIQDVAGKVDWNDSSRSNDDSRQEP